MLERNDPLGRLGLLCMAIAIGVPIGAALLSNYGYSFNNNVFCGIPVFFFLLGGFIGLLREISRGIGDK